MKVGMKVFVISITVLMILGILFYFIKKNKKINSIPGTTLSDMETDFLKERTYNDKMDILLGEMSRDEFKTTEMIEVTDLSTLSYINSFVPTFLDEAAKVMSRPNIPTEGLFKVVTPKGVELVQSKEVSGAVRGYFKGTDGKIAGQANLIPFEIDSTLGNAMQSLSSVMNVASILVGQYYMSEINAKLQTIEDEVKSISSFQKNEFESNVITKISDVMELSKFSNEIVRSKELRINKLNRLENLKGELAQLIEQLLLQIEQELKPVNKKRIANYEEKIKVLDRQIQFLVGLMMSLQELSNIELVLGRGERTKELVFSRYNMEEEKVLILFDKIKAWHLEQGIVYDIDLENNRKAKTGIKKTFGVVQALRDENKKYEELDLNFAQMINRQIDLSLDEPIKINKPDQVSIIYDSESTKSYVSLS